MYKAYLHILLKQYCYWILSLLPKLYMHPLAAAAA